MCFVKIDYVLYVVVFFCHVVSNKIILFSLVFQLCHQTLLDFRLCLGFIEPPDSESDASYFTRPRENFPSHLSKDMVLKVVVVSLICLLHLRKKGELFF